MALFSPTTKKLEDLFESASGARKAAVARFPTVSAMKEGWSRVTKVPEVALAIEEQTEYRQQAGTLADTISELVIGKLRKEAGAKRTSVKHAWKVKAMCGDGHYLTSAAIASIDTGEHGTEKEVMAQLNSIRLTHADLTHSLHNETIQDGFVYHGQCQQPCRLELVGKVHRLVVKEDPSEKVNAIAEDMAKLPYFRERRFRQQAVMKELAYLLRADGTEKIYGSVYEALRQTMHRAVTIADLVKNSKASKEQVPTLWPLLGDATERGISRNEAEARLRKNPFIMGLEEIVARYISVPIVVTVSRVKGASLGDKYILIEHFRDLREAYDKGLLQSFMRRVGVEPTEGMVTQGNPHDIVSESLIFHGNIPYNPSAILAATANGNGKNGTAFPEASEEEVLKKMYDIFYWLTGVPAEKRGYQKLNGCADFKSPKFECGEARETKFGFSVTPEGITDKIVIPTKTGYKAKWVLLQTPEGHILEVQMQTNLMDTMAELDPEQSHDQRKLRQMAMIDYLVEQRIVSPAKVYFARRMSALDGNAMEPVLNGKHNRAFALAK